ncbi:MAG: class I SAM-dependent methyltransferase [Candidatus Niyogibacteria bacterium]|nr:MAG: class I SAM-dependent methyltransferase [Candidatus Niyogibacteria bacterium]
MNIPDQKFYDKVAKKFGGYKSEAIHKSHFPNGNPEEIFLEQLIKYGHKDKTALDIGCADGRFTLKIAEKFHKTFGIDISSEMLAKAKQFQEEQKVSNVTFQKAEAEKLPFKDKYFDLIYSRRGPTPYQEIHRVLKKSGCFIEIGIGEKDAKELKEVFGRGQNFGGWDKSVLASKKTELETLGFKEIFAKEFFYSEYYSDIDNFSLWLESVPIFKDFDPTKDGKFLSEYVEKMKTQEGIELKRHRVVIVAHKI